MTHHHLNCNTDTIHWGWFDATLKPILTIDSGDRVTVDTVSGGPASLPGPGYHVPPELLQIHEKSPRRLPGHILTGPIAVRGAMPGDVLEVRILDIQLRQDWGYTFIRPLAGALPNDFATGEQMIVALDRERRVGVERRPVRDVGQVHTHLHQVVKPAAGTDQRGFDIGQHLPRLVLEARVRQLAAVGRDGQLPGHVHEAASHHGMAVVAAGRRQAQGLDADRVHRGLLHQPLKRGQVCCTWVPCTRW
jgi:hypothetical protein